MPHEFKQTWMGMGRKLLRRVGWHGVPTVSHWCPACREIHDFAVDQPFTNGAKWTFDGNTDKPTFTPSMNIVIGPFGDGTKRVCHYFLRAGQIQYLGDCTHEMKNLTVELPPIPFTESGGVEFVGSTRVG